MGRTGKISTVAAAAFTSVSGLPTETGSTQRLSAVIAETSIRMPIYAVWALLPSRPAAGGGL